MLECLSGSVPGRGHDGIQLWQAATENAPALRFASFFKAVPAHPAAEDYLATLSGWQLLGNDVAGDCNAVTWANMRRLVTASLATEYYPTQAQVWQFYQTQNPGFDPVGTKDTNGPGSSQDQGMDVQTGRSTCTLAADHPREGCRVRQGGSHEHRGSQSRTGNLRAASGSRSRCSRRIRRNSRKASPGPTCGSAIDGGHAILGGGYRTDIKFITWATETMFAESFWTGVVQGNPLVEEAWAAIWPEHLGTRSFEEGVDQTQLAADYQALTGRPADSELTARCIVTGARTRHDVPVLGELTRGG